MKRQILCLVIVFLVLAIIISPVKSLAAPYYEGKMIRLIVGMEPGGGNDRSARVMARHLPKYIPGKPMVVVENMPGGDSIIAANYLYNVANPDGLTITMIGRTLVFSQLMGIEGIKFDLTKFSWVGSLGSETTIFAVRKDLPYENVDDLKKAKKTIFVAGAGPTSNTSQFSNIMREYLIPNIKVVDYRSSTELFLALERKEADAAAAAWENIKMNIERIGLRPLFRSRISKREIEHLPVNEDLTSDPMGKKMMAMHAMPNGAGRPFVAPPGTPANVMAILRDAFDKAIRYDPELKADVEKIKMDFEFVPGEKCLEMQKYILGQPVEIVKEFKRFVKF